MMAKANIDQEDDSEIEPDLILEEGQVVTMETEVIEADSVKDPRGQGKRTFAS